MRKFLGFFLVSIIVVATTGFVVNTHYCQNELKSSALFLKAEPCHGPASKAVCPMHADQSSSDDEQNDCCDDKCNLTKSETEQIHIIDEIDSDRYQKCVPHPGSLLADHKHAGYHFHHRYLNYKPPTVVCDDLARLQTFMC